MEHLHPSDGSDEQARDLEITLRIGVDGRVYVHDITADLLPVFLALDPTNEDLQRRAAAAATYLAETTP
jgi:hypothetical protein